jgi:hypothetical protein
LLNRLKGIRCIEPGLGVDVGLHGCDLLVEGFRDEEVDAGHKVLDEALLTLENGSDWYEVESEEESESEAAVYDIFCRE